MPELPEELVEKAARANWAEVTGDDPALFDSLPTPYERRTKLEEAREWAEHFDLSSILEQLERALAVAEKFEKEARDALWAQKQAEEQVWRLTDELADTRLSGGPVAATPPTVLDGQDSAAALPRTISRWECPMCGTPAGQECTCSYSGGNVEVWYVEKGAYIAVQSRLEAAEGERDRLRGFGDAQTPSVAPRQWHKKSLSVSGEGGEEG